MSKLLIIDDDPNMTDLLKTLLELEGYNVVSTRKWAGIVDFAAQEQPDLILMDCILPDIDGVDILTSIRSQESTSDIKVVMTSGINMTEECLSAGADAFLLKPYNPDVLTQTIKDHLIDSAEG
ncbi:MAG: response regulator [Anaerolineales bacterium]|jgi:CheY-like chemotaxis protein